MTYILQLYDIHLQVCTPYLSIKCHTIPPQSFLLQVLQCAQTWLYWIQNAINLNCFPCKSSKENSAKVWTWWSLRDFWSVFHPNIYLVAQMFISSGCAATLLCKFLTVVARRIELDVIMLIICNILSCGWGMAKEKEKAFVCSILKKRKLGFILARY